MPADQARVAVAPAALLQVREYARADLTQLRSTLVWLVDHTP